jgi:hypothetical protein
MLNSNGKDSLAFHAVVLAIAVSLPIPVDRGREGGEGGANKVVFDRELLFLLCKVNILQ